HDALDVELARDVFEESAAPTEQHGNEVKLQLAEKPGAQSLPDRPAAVQCDIFASSCELCLRDRGLEPVGREVERGTFPDVVGAGAVSEYEDGHLERWVRPPHGFCMCVAVHAH